MAPKYLKTDHGGTQVIAPLFPLTKAQIEAAKREEARAIIDGMVADGLLVRIQGGRIVEREHYRQVRGRPVICEATKRGDHLRQIRLPAHHKTRSARAQHRARHLRKLRVAGQKLLWMQWEAVGKALHEAEALPWYLGDWWCYGHEYGKRARLVAKGVFGLSFQTLMNYGWVANKVTTSRRQEVLTFDHHATVARFDPADQRAWLQRAAEGEWSVGSARADHRPAAGRVTRCLPPAAAPSPSPYQHRRKMGELF